MRLLHLGDRNLKTLINIRPRLSFLREFRATLKDELDRVIEGAGAIPTRQESMIFFRLILVNLLRHIIRTFISIAGIAFSVAAMLTVVTVLQGAVGMFSSILSSGSEIIVFERNVSDLFFSVCRQKRKRDRPMAHGEPCESSPVRHGIQCRSSDHHLLRRNSPGRSNSQCHMGLRERNPV